MDTLILLSRIPSCRRGLWSFTDTLEVAPIEAENFLEYLLANYVRDDAKFSPPLWAASSPADDPHTTNPGESFNSHYNSLFYHATPHIHLVTETVLMAIQLSTDLIFHPIRRGHSNPRANNNDERCTLLKDMYSQYAQGEWKLTAAAPATNEVSLPAYTEEEGASSERRNPNERLYEFSMID